VADPGAGSVGGTAMDDKRAFGAASGFQSHVPMQQWQQQLPPTQEQRSGYQNVAAPHPGYTDASRMPPAQADQFPSGGFSLAGLYCYLAGQMLTLGYFPDLEGGRVGGIHFGRSRS